MSDQDLIDLYSGQILALAADMPMTEPLAGPDAEAKKRAPLCGSTISVQLSVSDGLVTGFSQNVKACALGQAAASVIGANIIGRTRAEVQRGHDQLLAMLKEDGPAPDAPFDGLKVLLPARGFKNRHASIMLCFDAILDAWRTLDA